MTKGTIGTEAIVPFLGVYVGLHGFILSILRLDQL